MARQRAVKSCQVIHKARIAQVSGSNADGFVHENRAIRACIISAYSSSSLHTLNGTGSPMRNTLDSNVAISLPCWLVMSIW